MKKTVHWYCTNKPPLRIWRAYFDSPLPFWYNLLLIVASKLWGRWTLEFSRNNFAAYFYWQLHIRYRISYTKSSCISPTKQKEPLTRSEVSGKWKHSHKAAIIMKIALRFRKAIFGDPCGNRTHVNGVRGRCLNRLTNGPYCMHCFSAIYLLYSLLPKCQQIFWNLSGIFKTKRV